MRADVLIGIQPSAGPQPDPSDPGARLEAASEVLRPDGSRSRLEGLQANREVMISQ